jgi:hypothetical protein
VVLGRRDVSDRPGAVERRFAGDLDVVLYRHRNAGERKLRQVGALGNLLGFP